MLTQDTAQEDKEMKKMKEKLTCLRGQLLHWKAPTKCLIGVPEKKDTMVEKQYWRKNDSEVFKN